MNTDGEIAERVRQEVADTRRGLAASRDAIEAHRKAADSFPEPSRSYELGMIDASLMWIEKFECSLDEIEASRPPGIENPEAAEQ